MLRNKGVVNLWNDATDRPTLFQMQPRVCWPIRSINLAALKALYNLSQNATVLFSVFFVFAGAKNMFLFTGTPYRRVFGDKKALLMQIRCLFLQQ